MLYKKERDDIPWMTLAPSLWFSFILAPGGRTMRDSFLPAIVIIGKVGTCPLGTASGRGTRIRTSLLSLLAEMMVPGFPMSRVLIRTLDGSGPVWYPGT